MTKYIIQIKYTGDNEFEDTLSFETYEEAQTYLDEMPHPEGRWKARIIERTVNENIL